MDLLKAAQEAGPFMLTAHQLKRSRAH